MSGVFYAVAAVGVASGLHLGLARARQRVDGASGRRRRLGRDPGGLRAAGLALAALQWGVWGAALYAVSEAHPALSALRGRIGTLVGAALRMPLFALSERSVTALDLLLLPLAMAAIWLAVNAVTHALRASLLRALGLSGSTEETLAGLLRHGLLFAASLIALQAVGVDVRGIAIAGGVLGVGIGFGLQNIANNFVSGILIGLERPIRPGDFVEVEGYVGTVVRVGARSTTLRTLDRVSVVVPNARFLESSVVNWSLDDPTTRLHVPVGVAYGSDVTRVRAALLAAARAHPAILREPRPQVQMRGFGSSALDFELLAWTRDPRNQFTLVSDLNYLVEAELAKVGVAIPFPQVDLHIRAPEPLASRPEASEEPAERDAAARLLDRVVREDRGPEEWTVAEIEAAAARMADAEGVAVADRRFLLRVHPSCFVGGEAVTWLAGKEGLSRSEAVSLGERMLELGHIRHVLDEHGFRDGHFFYRFTEGEPARAIS